MDTAKLRAGDFVWCSFPEREHPVVPARSQHVGYVVLVTESEADRALAAIVAYTTSRLWTSRRVPRGVILFDKDQAAAVGQSKPFTLDLRRLARIPISLRWFPRLDESSAGVLGQASDNLRARLETILAELISRRGELIEMLGPGRSRGR